MMSDSLNRRTFLTASAALSLGATALGASPQKAVGAKRPIAISSANGMAAVTKAMELMKAGMDPLDAAVAGVAIVEADPEDHTVGYGGIPNEDGIVELDAAVMHGPTHGGGAVASIRNIMHPAAVARLVMKRTDHCLIVGEGATRLRLCTLQRGQQSHSFLMRLQRKLRRLVIRQQIHFVLRLEHHALQFKLRSQIDERR